MRTPLFDINAAKELPVAVAIQRGAVALRWNTSSKDVVIGGETYPAESGAMVSSIACGSDGTENNADILIHARDGGPVEPGDAARGLLDGWPISVMFFDSGDPDGTATEMMPGAIVGSVTEDANGMVAIAASGQLIKGAIELTEHFSLAGREDLGDDHCKMPIMPADIGRGVHFVPPNISTGLLHVNDAYGRMLNGSPATYNNLYFEATNEGDTDPDAAPEYPSVVGDTVVDGEVTFIARNAWTRSATGEAISAFEIQLDSLPDPRATFQDPVTGEYTWYVLGAIYVRSGNLANFPKIPIRAWDADTLTVTLFLPVSVTDIPAGTELEIAPGCDLTREMCHSRFNNIINLRAETFVPPPEVKF